MTSRISIVAAVAGVAMLFAVPAALADHQFGDRQARAEAAQQLDVQTMLDRREGAQEVRRVDHPAESTSRTAAHPVFDDWFRDNAAGAPVLVSVPTADRGIEWAQLGLGFALGILLALGVWLATRVVGVRHLAH